MGRRDDADHVAAVKRSEPEFDEQRRTPRFAADLPVAVTQGDTVTVGRTRNLSLGGLQLTATCAQPLVVGATVGVSFTLPNLAEPISVQGHVRWVCDVDRQSAGIQFAAGLRAKQTWALQQFFRRGPSPL